MQVLLIGLGREGWSSLQYCLSYFPDETSFVLIDDQPRSALSADWQSSQVDKLIEQQRVQFFTTNSFLKQKQTWNQPATVALVSPGIPPNHLLIKCLDQSSIYQTSNVQMFFDLILPERAQPSPFTQFLPRLNYRPTVIGITGTKGKSTTTAAIHHVLKETGQFVLLGGNIGVPPLDLVKSLQANSHAKTYVVLELSSHQLARLTSSPNIAVIMAVTPEHLDYYPDFASYQNAKANICRFQTDGDLTIFNWDNQASAKIAQLSPGKKLKISQANLTTDAYFAKDQIFAHHQPVIQTSQLKLIGQHNYLNLLPSVLISLHLGIANDAVQAALSTFRGLPHRLQLVFEKNGTKYYNDSLATTPEATVAAIRAFPHQPIILIAGGFDRGLDFAELAEVIAQNKVKAALLLPTTGENIAAQLTKHVQSDLLVEQVPNLTIAVERAKQLSRPEDIVLLSPASASFNQFKDYAERGETFVRLVTG